MLRVVRDPDRCEIALHVNPLVLFRVAILLRVRHQATPLNRLSPVRIPAEPPLFSAACKMESEPPALCTSGRESPRTRPCPRPNTPGVRKQARCSFPASAKASHLSPLQRLRPLHCSSGSHRAQCRGRPFQAPPASASSPPLSRVQARRVPRNRPSPSCSSDPALLPQH